MNPKEFLEVTEAALLTHLGEELHKFFAEYNTIYTSWDEAQVNAGSLRVLYQCQDGASFVPLPPALQKMLLFKREEKNPKSSILPVAQCNMVANATFHLLAQQIAIVLHEMPNLNVEKVLETSFANIRKLVARYQKEIQEEEAKNGQDHGEGHPTQSAD